MDRQLERLRGGGKKLRGAAGDLQRAFDDGEALLAAEESANVDLVFGFRAVAEDEETVFVVLGKALPGALAQRTLKVLAPVSGRSSRLSKKAACFGSARRR